MFARRLRIEYTEAAGEPQLCPVGWIDNFAMRNFTNDAIFDDTLPLQDGLLEVGNRVPLDSLQQKMQSWFRRKGYLQLTGDLYITELRGEEPLAASVLPKHESAGT